ncbi:MAG: triose-phosphate isomerase [Patescibacteria group bacterium]|jgi:triosephosphate isomerase
MKKLIVANWKMYKTPAETGGFIQQLTAHTWPMANQAIICAPFTVLATLQQVTKQTTIQYGAQNMHWEDKGAYTGEISALMLVDLGCKYVIIGHSERRRDNNETSETINKKVLAALKHNLIPIICVGENATQNTTKQTLIIIKEQVEQALLNVTATQLANIVIAYEPIWAIGTGKTPTPAQAETVHAFIRTLVANTTPIIYGGSVTVQNIKTFLTQPNINGALIGSASLDAANYATMLS